MKKGLQDERRIRMSSSSVDLRRPKSFPAFSPMSAPRKLVRAGALSLFGLVTFGFSSVAKASSIGVAGAATFTKTSASFTAWQLVIAATLLLPSVSSALAMVLSQGLQLSVVWYMAHLTTSPLITKSITAGVIGVIGDYMAQGLERLMLKSRPDNPKHQIHNPTKHYDSRRGLSILLDGLFISGPLMHLAYDLFEKILPVSGSSGGLAAMSHVLADSIFLDSIFVATTFVVTGLVEGYNRRQLTSQLKKDYLPTLMASWVTSLGLLPIEFICFRCLPVSLRVMAVNFIDVIWDTVISFMAHRSRVTHTLPSELSALTDFSLSTPAPTEQPTLVLSG